MEPFQFGSPFSNPFGYNPASTSNTYTSPTKSSPLKNLGLGAFNLTDASAAEGGEPVNNNLNQAAPNGKSSLEQKTIPRKFLFDGISQMPTVGDFNNSVAFFRANKVWANDMENWVAEFKVYLEQLSQLQLAFQCEMYFGWDLHKGFHAQFNIKDTQETHAAFEEAIQRADSILAAKVNQHLHSHAGFGPVAFANPSPQYVQTGGGHRAQGFGGSGHYPRLISPPPNASLSGNALQRLDGLGSTSGAQGHSLHGLGGQQELPDETLTPTKTQTPGRGRGRGRGGNRGGAARSRAAPKEPKTPKDSPAPTRKRASKQKNDPTPKKVKIEEPVMEPATESVKDSTHHAELDADYDLDGEFEGREIDTGDGFTQVVFD